MLERDLTTKILRHLRTVPNCFCWKQAGGQFGTSGLPDVICCIAGIFCVFEVKNNTWKLSKLQEMTLRKITEAGGRAYVVRSLDEVVSILKMLGVVNENSVAVSGQEAGDT